MEYSEDSPDKPVKRSPQISDGSPFIAYTPHSDFAKSSSKRSLTRSDFEAMKKQRQDSGSEPEEVLEESQGKKDLESGGENEDEEEAYEEEGFEEEQESSIASNISY